MCASGTLSPSYCCGVILISNVLPPSSRQPNHDCVLTICATDWDEVASVEVLSAKPSSRCPDGVSYRLSVYAVRHVKSALGVDVATPDKSTDAEVVAIAASGVVVPEATSFAAVEEALSSVKTASVVVPMSDVCCVGVDVPCGSEVVISEDVAAESSTTVVVASEATDISGVLVASIVVVVAIVSAAITVATPRIARMAIPTTAN
jgi:hypothetical protein